MEAVISYVVQLVAGAVGGVGTGKALKSADLGTIGNVIAGAVGGVGGTWIATLIPALQSMLAGGGAGALVGQGVSGLVGGGVLTVIAGLIKNAMAPK